MWTTCWQDLDVSNQSAIDQMMLALDGTENKCKSLVFCFHYLFFIMKIIRWYIKYKKNESENNNEKNKKTVYEMLIIFISDVMLV